MRPYKHKSKNIYEVKVYNYRPEIPPFQELVEGAEIKYFDFIKECQKTVEYKDVKYNEIKTQITPKYHEFKNQLKVYNNFVKSYNAAGDSTVEIKFNYNPETPLILIGLHYE